MNIKKLIATTAIGAVLASVAAVAIAGPASANDQGLLLPGSILWFNQVGPLATQTPATQLFGGTDASVVGAWKTLTTQNACPAGTLQMQTNIRIPQTGVPEIDLEEVPLGAVSTTQDATGRFYTSTGTQADRISKPQVIAYQLAHPGTNVYPIISVCFDGDLNPLGYFRNLVSITGTTNASLSWSIDSTPIVDSRATSTTTLASSSTSTTVGDSVTLTATVAPASSTGSVEFFAGATSLGTGTLAGGIATKATTALPVGTAAVTAVYAGDTANKASTSAPVSIVVAGAPAASTTTTLAVDVVAGAPYQAVTLTCTVAPAAAAGSVQFKDGTTTIATVPVAAGAALTTLSTFGAGAHSFTAVFVPADSALFTGSTSAAVTATYVSTAVSDEQTVVVTIPAGSITITTPYTPAVPLNLGTAVLNPVDSTYSASAPFTGIVITDTRAGNLGFTASVVAGDFVNGGSSFTGKYAGLTGVTPDQVAGNALLASQVITTNNAPFTVGLATPKVFAAHAAGLTIGTANLHGVFGIDKVPSSVTPGLFSSTVTFSVI